MSFISYLINGISLGSVYALIALGYTMVYGIAKMLNFAHGDVIMVGAFITYTMCSTMGLSPVIGVLAAVVACTLLGMAIEKVAYKPLRKAASSLVRNTDFPISSKDIQSQRVTDSIYISLSATVISLHTATSTPSSVMR